MSGAILDFKVYDKELRKDFKKMIAKVKDLRPAMKRAGVVGLKDVMEHFRKEAGPDKKWAKLKTRKGKILQNTGKLKNSISYKAMRFQTYLGTNIKYASIHQFGGVIKAKRKPYLKFKTDKGWVQKKQVTIPARPYLWLSDIGIDKIMGRILEYVTK